LEERRVAGVIVIINDDGREHLFVQNRAVGIKETEPIDRVGNLVVIGLGYRG